jgi:hypothetical protein
MNTNTESRRYKRLRLDPHVWVEHLRDGNEYIITQGLPSGTAFVWAAWDFERCCFWMTLFNEDWPEIPMGEIIPEIEEVPQLMVTNKAWQEQGFDD